MELVHSHDLHIVTYYETEKTTISMRNDFIGRNGPQSRGNEMKPMTFFHLNNWYFYCFVISYDAIITFLLLSLFSLEQQQDPP